MKNRVKEIREKRGWTLEQLAERSRLSTSQISKIENEKRGWSVESLEMLAEALGVKVSELLDANDLWQQVPVFGVVEEAGIVRPYDKAKGKRPRATAPMAFGALLALMIPTDSLYPRYLKGQVIFCAKDPVDPAECINRECLVQLDDGVTLLRVIQAGTVKNKYNLVIHNQIPALNQVIVACRPVVYTAPAD